MRSNRVALTFVLTLPLCLALGCSGKGNPKDPKDPNPDPNPDFWLVGDQGSMFGVTLDYEASTYPLEHHEDLRAITCFGESTAWVVGGAGTLLRTRDAGRTWSEIHEPELAAIEWRALSAAEATPEGIETVYFVGDDGALVRTPDGGQSFITIDGGDIDFTGVASAPDGERAIAVADDGSIWQLDAEGRSALHQHEVGLAAVAMDGDELVAVGHGGAMLRSHDAGSSWESVALPTTRTLHAVRLGHAGLSVAVGDGGVVVRVEDELADAVELADAELGLFGLHLRHDGFGQAVGANGTLLVTDDAGLTWEPVALPTTANLRGVDDFHPGGHL